MACEFKISTTFRDPGPTEDNIYPYIHIRINHSEDENDKDIIKQLQGIFCEVFQTVEPPWSLDNQFTRFSLSRRQHTRCYTLYCVGPQKGDKGKAIGEMVKLMYRDANKLHGQKERLVKDLLDKVAKAEGFLSAEDRLEVFEALKKCDKKLARESLAYPYDKMLATHGFIREFRKCNENTPEIPTDITRVIAKHI